MTDVRGALLVIPHVRSRAIEKLGWMRLRSASKRIATRQPALVSGLGRPLVSGDTARSSVLVWDYRLDRAVRVGGRWFQQAEDVGLHPIARELFVDRRFGLRGPRIRSRAIPSSRCVDQARASSFFPAFRCPEIDLADPLRPRPGPVA